MCRILDPRYEKADLKQFTAEKCQHLTHSEQEDMLTLKNMKVYLMELLAHGAPTHSN